MRSKFKNEKLISFGRQQQQQQHYSQPNEPTLREDLREELSSQATDATDHIREVCTFLRKIPRLKP